MKPTSKTIFNHLLLSITFNDKFWRSRLDILLLIIEHNNVCHHKKNQFKQHFATTFRPLTKYIMILILDQGSEIGKL